MRCRECRTTTGLTAEHVSHPALTAAAIRCRVRCDTTGRSGRALWTRRKSVKTTSHIGHRADRRSSVSSQSGAPPNRRKISGAAAAPLQCESQRNTAGGAGAAAGTVRSGRRGYIISALVCLRSVSLRRAATRVTRCRAATGARTLSRHARPRRAGFRVASRGFGRSATRSRARNRSGWAGAMRTTRSWAALRAPTLPRRYR